MGFYKNGKWQPDAADIASGEYMEPESELRIAQKRITELEATLERVRGIEHSTHPSWNCGEEFSAGWKACRELVEEQLKPSNE